jgi:hypothetical protein
MEIPTLHLTSETSGNALPEVFNFLWMENGALTEASFHLIPPHHAARRFPVEKLAASL